MIRISPKSCTCLRYHFAYFHSSMAAVLQQVFISNNGELPAELSSRIHPAQLRPRVPAQPRLWGGQLEPKPGGLQLQRAAQPCHSAQWRLSPHPLCEDTSASRLSTAQRPIELGVKVENASEALQVERSCVCLIIQCASSNLHGPPLCIVMGAKGRRLMQFPSAAQYPAQGLQAPIIRSCISYAAHPCDSSALTYLGDVTFDATRPTLTISKVSEQYGDPTTSSSTRRLQQTAPSPPLFALMLFNFSKAGALSSLALKYGLCRASLPSPSHLLGSSHCTPTEVKTIAHQTINATPRA